MGIGPGAFLKLVELSTRFSPTGRSVMLGRQSFRMGHGDKSAITDTKVYQRILDRVGVVIDAETLAQDDLYAETMFRALGFGEIESLDASDYENADLVWDLNRPVPADWHGQFDFIFDGGTIEHVFNVPQAFGNVFDMLRPGGVFVGLNPFNGFPSHGMYQFAPELIWTYWKHGCGCEVMDCTALSDDGKFTRAMPDPADLGGRIPIRLGSPLRGRMPAGRINLWYTVKKTDGAQRADHVQQSDYVATWTDHSHSADKEAI